MPHPLTILGLESSCDETALAILRLEDNATSPEILVNITQTQIKMHLPYGGVVPELAARNHLEMMPHLLQAGFAQAGLQPQHIDVFAATAGPGLAGGLIVGLMTGKGLAWGLKKPFIAVNHLEGHLASPFLTQTAKFPALALLISGGHCQLILIHKWGTYEQLGSTRDDAVGESFDKVARILGLNYPGGPEVEKKAAQGDAKRYDLPRPLSRELQPDFSFSGLKTAVMRLHTRLSNESSFSEQQICDLCASFQQAIIDCLISRLERAVCIFKQSYHIKNTPLMVIGGVAANQAIRDALHHFCEKQDMALVTPQMAFCTDNAAMIALAGYYNYHHSRDGNNLNAGPRPQWPLV